MPPSIPFAAPLVRAAIATLEASMPGQVAAFNAEPANLVDLTAPQSYWFGANDLLSSAAFPQIEVAAVTGDSGSWAIGRSEVDHDPRVNVAIWQQGAAGDVPLLYEEMLGYARCVVECLSPTDAFGPGVSIAETQGFSWRIDVLPADPTAPTPAAGRTIQKWMGSALLQWHLETVERFA